MFLLLLQQLHVANGGSGNNLFNQLSRIWIISVVFTTKTKWNEMLMKSIPYQQPLAHLHVTEAGLYSVIRVHTVFDHTEDSKVLLIMSSHFNTFHCFPNECLLLDSFFFLFFSKTVVEYLVGWCTCKYICWWGGCVEIIFGSLWNLKKI